MIHLYLLYKKIIFPFLIDQRKQYFLSATYFLSFLGRKKESFMLCVYINHFRNTNELFISRLLPKKYIYKYILRMRMWLCFCCINYYTFYWINYFAKKKKLYWFWFCEYIWKRLVEIIISIWINCIGLPNIVILYVNNMCLNLIK